MRGRIGVYPPFFRTMCTTVSAARQSAGWANPWSESPLIPKYNRRSGVSGVSLASRRTCPERIPMQNELRRVVDTIPGLVWTARPDGHADFLNQRWCEYTGLSLEEACGWGWQAAI